MQGCRTSYQVVEVGSGLVVWYSWCRMDDDEVCFEKKLGEERQRLVSEEVGEWYRRNKLAKEIE